jgi:hypothetical protein
VCANSLRLAHVITGWKGSMLCLTQVTPIQTQLSKLHNLARAYLSAKQNLIS